MIIAKFFKFFDTIVQVIEYIPTNNLNVGYFGLPPSIVL